jgi:hypothetical protein
MRPLAIGQEEGIVDLSEVVSERILVESIESLGNGVIDTLRDIVYVRPDTFDKMATLAIAKEVSELNRRLLEAGTPYVLIGPGRWGTANPTLGIPVNWDDVSGARVIAETFLQGFVVEPSQASHFFHNVVGFHVLYLTTTPMSGGMPVDWEWLQSQPGEQGAFVRHVQVDQPVKVMVDGRSRRGVLLKGEG